MSLEVNQAAINFGTVSISVSITRLTRERIVVFSVADAESQGEAVQTTVRFPIPESEAGEPAAESASVVAPLTILHTPPVPANILDLGEAGRPSYPSRGPFPRRAHRSQVSGGFRGRRA